MKNLSKLIIWALPFIFSHVAWCGRAIIFDRPELISFDDGRFLNGYYDSRDNRRSCVFLFSQVGGEVDGRPQPYTKIKILTFVPKENNFSFDGRNRFFDIKGELYRRGGAWIIRTDEGQAGCENALGAFTSFPADKVGGEIFSVTKKIPAIGIRLVSRKSFFYDFRDEQFIVRKGYLTPGDGVVVLQTHGKFSYVRFSDPGPDTNGRVTAGWVYSADLVNPFPAASKQ
ncbi:MULTISPECIES: hypothetical protein [Paraburkholderia]|uniref:hypothetical protein n=1 Tax=Paraburkholderia TaxID=1822464 RepID=UPI0013A6D5A2|nr:MULTISPECIES: hypothetical protein [Paraburkholderia]MDH6152281.1 hypothetical protein [Paraburkholderia sp. WSM4179]